MKIYCDGSLKESCVVIENYKNLPIISRYPFAVTNNESEYWAVIAAIGYSTRFIHQGDGVQIFTDSQLAVEQGNGRWKCRKEHLRPFCGLVQKMLAELPGVSLSWIPREQNLAGIVLEGRK